jgi:hypothetical protein
LVIESGDAPEVDATIAGESRQFAAVTYGGRPLADAVSTGDLVVTGDVDSADRFLHLYSLPAVASP